MGPTNNQMQDLVKTMTQKANQVEVPTNARNCQMQKLTGAIDRKANRDDVPAIPQVPSRDVNKATAEFGATCAQDKLKDGLGMLSGVPHKCDVYSGFAEGNTILVQWTCPVDIAEVSFLQR